MGKNQCPEGYVQVTDIKVMQKLLLQLMVKFHEVCEKHGLIYNMCGGTLKERFGMVYDLCNTQKSGVPTAFLVVLAMRNF